MYCKNCGYKIEDNLHICPYCGALVDNISKEAKTSNKRYWLIPFSFAIMVAIAVTFYFFYEIGVNKKVEEIRAKAEDMALQGNFDTALNFAKKGLALRPNHKVLQQDLVLINFGKTVYEKLETANKYADDKKFDLALKSISAVDKDLEGRSGEYFDMLSNLSKKYKTQVEVKQLYDDAKNKNTIDELADALSRLSYIDSPDAKNIDKLIRQKIANIAYSNANELLKDKQFNEALKVIEKAMQYDSSNAKLISFKKTIVDQKTAFENAEAQRMQQAMISAAKEDAMNRTNAVSVLNVKNYINGYGDFVIEGEIKNVATKPIYEVEIYYAIYDANGNTIGDGNTYVYPVYLSPLQKGSFSNIHYGLSNADHIKITGINWYID
ncbi:FxLYD domain-containing protein [Thermoanaerobacterium thermosaccharolyticum]|uniref:FxLYD domain-containing protein n=1 Tax=Thermoanaerobacterium thermosaccharolyticum TaxID=1517 RepID=UPI0017858A3E|nr:FxLYD domain-containing protein [Thermoanaerobacterium thermosaccharolyticum]MBE0069268.1 zinc ribbon domain-containing protein [Thermoanaerobacterium thermosaccharolyticum]MBE0229054.1 zinc ribbon domain-containing protein [Thermoanaerobacterium thermosaccharolyticum]